MSSISRIWIRIALMVLGVQDSHGGAIHSPYSYYNSTCNTPLSSITTSTTITLPPHSSSVTTVNSTLTSITIPITPSYSHPTTISVTNITVTTPVTISTTTTLSSVVTVSPPIITPPPPTCGAACSVYAGTVNLFFWPTNNQFTYPSTYVDTALDYTFTSPSVYMIVNTIYGYSVQTQNRLGPSATSAIFALDLDEVSTIVSNGAATQQLTLNDLGTDCPQSEDASVIATMAPDSRCDPILAAPSKVQAWVKPCDACHRFGLFDPPYAIPTITGGLLGTTTTTVVAPSATSEATSATASPAPALSTPEAVSTTNIPTTSTSAQTATDTSAIESSSTASSDPDTSAIESSSASSSDATTTISSATASATGPADPAVTAFATRVRAGLTYPLAGVAIAMLFL